MCAYTCIRDIPYDPQGDCYVDTRSRKQEGEHLLCSTADRTGLEADCKSHEASVLLHLSLLQLDGPVKEHAWHIPAGHNGART